jgi:hypothetical protein
MQSTESDGVQGPSFSVRDSFERLRLEFSGQPVWSKSLFSRSNERLLFLWSASGPSLGIPVTEAERTDTLKISDQLALKPIEPPRVAKMNNVTDWIGFCPIGENWDIDLFCSLVESLLPELETADDLASCVKAKVDEWASMLRLMTGQNDSKMKVQGLWGELAVLHHFLVLEGVDALKSWRGPESGRHDFEFKVSSLEVKTSTTLASFRAKINGLAQLEPLGAKPLELAIVRVDWAPDGVSVPELITSIKGMLNPAGAKRLDAKLESLAIESWDPVQLNETRFSIHDTNLFAVRDDFPRITAGTITNPIDVGRISSVEYEVTLSSAAAKQIELIVPLTMQDVH